MKQMLGSGMKSELSKIKLLYVTRESYPTARPDVLTLFGKYLPRLGVCSDIVAVSEREGRASVQDWPGGRALVVPRYGNRFMNQLRAIRHDLRHLATLKSEAYDAVVVRDKILSALMALTLRGGARIPIFYWMSYPMPEADIIRARLQGRRLGWARWFFTLLRGHVTGWLLYRWVLPRVDHVFVQSQRMLEELTGRGVPPARMTPVPMGVDLEMLEKQAGAVSCDPRLTGKRVLLYLGALEKPRRLDFLLEMLSLIQKRFPDAILVLVGDASERMDREWLLQRSEELGVKDSVIITGWLSMTEAWAYVLAAEIGFSPIPPGFLYDVSSPTKVVEYLALGLPAIANDIPDQKQVLEGSGAGICLPYNVEAFAQAACGLLDDDERRSAMGRRGPAYIESFRNYAALSATVSDRLVQVIGESSSDKLGRASVCNAGK